MNKFNEYVFYWNGISNKIPLRNAISDRGSQVAKMLMYDYDIDIENVRLDVCGRNSSPGMYLLEFGFCTQDEFRIMIENIKRDNILDILHRDGIPVVCWVPEEKDVYIVESPESTYMKQLFEMLTAHPVNVYIVGGNICHKYDARIDSQVDGKFYFPIFEFNFYRGCNLENFVIPEINDDNVCKHFISLNNVARAGKVYTVAMLKSMDLLKDNHVSLIHSVSGERDHGVFERLLNKNTTLSFAQKRDRAKWVTRTKQDHVSYDNSLPPVPLILDKSGADFDSWEYIQHGDGDYIGGLKSFYTEVGVALINETHTVPEDEICITEKVFYPMAYGKPFLINAPMHYLRHLRSQGYQTFPELFDESYDDIPDAIDRMDHILAQIEELSKLSIQEMNLKIRAVRKSLLHNQRMIQNKQAMVYKMLTLLYTMTTITKE